MDKIEADKPRYVSWLNLAAVVIVLTLIGTVIYFGSLYKPYSVPSESMAPTLFPGDVFLTRRTACRPEALSQGMVVITSERSVPYVRRLIAGPGHTVQMTDGRLIIDGASVKREPANQAVEQGRILRETLPNGVSYLIWDMGAGYAFDDTPPVKVPQGRWFVMGDNRDNALDSRDGGPIAIAKICAVATNILTSPARNSLGGKL